MSENGKRRSVAGLMWRCWWVLAPVALMVIAALALAHWRATHLKWAEVMAAVARQKTINGVGRIYGPDGSEWAVAVWVGVDGPGARSSKAMLLPVKTRPHEKPGREVVELGNATDFCCLAEGLAAMGRIARVRASARSGRPSLETVVALPMAGLTGEMFSGRPPYPSLVRFYLDPDTKLVTAAELFVGAKAHTTVEYTYNKPLPKGFRPG